MKQLLVLKKKHSISSRGEHSFSSEISADSLTAENLQPQESSTTYQWRKMIAASSRWPQRHSRPIYLRLDWDRRSFILWRYRLFFTHVVDTAPLHRCSEIFCRLHGWGEAYILMTNSREKIMIPRYLLRFLNEIWKRNCVVYTHKRTHLREVALKCSGKYKYVILSLEPTLASIAHITFAWLSQSSKLHL